MAPKNTLKPLVLVGMMGAGKTAVGRLLAKRLGWRFVDSDKEIEKQAGASVAEIFSSSGEAAFRQYERATIAEYLTQPLSHEAPMVLSLGGGAVEDRDTRQLLKNHARSVWLKASPKTLLARIADTASRPLLSAKADREEILTGLLQSRERFYAQSDMIVETDHLTEEDIAERITQEMRL